MRRIPAFKDQIRKHNENISEMKQMTASDFENILQCALPLFEGLLPDEHNKKVLNMLYLLASAYTSSKLHMHTDKTVTENKNLISLLGESIRQFTKYTCAAHRKEILPSEARRLRRNRREVDGTTIFRKAVMKYSFNMNTPKMHSLGDYPYHIIEFGSLNSYTTEVVRAYDEN